MIAIWPEDWSTILLPSTPLIEIFVRGTAVYLSVFLLLRLILKRETAGIGVTDILVIVLLADAAQNAMSGDYHSIPDGVLLVLVIIFWGYALNWLGYRFPKLNRIVHPPPLLLVKDGQQVRQKMAHELLTEEELMSHLRSQGIQDLSEVKRAYMEGDGRITVIRKDNQY